MESLFLSFGNTIGCFFSSISPLPFPPSPYTHLCPPTTTTIT